MPYIAQKCREHLDNKIDDLVYMVSVAEDGRDGELNYIISSLISKLYGRNYRELNAAIGVLECTKQELYRRVLAPYEDIKLEQNGEVYANCRPS